ncbi:MAG: hypothetical protein MJ252_21340 [archaeon]|nr:hypothetical protein [archaeon]
MGNKQRKEEPTIQNENSSRSHAVLQVHILMEEKNETGFEGTLTFGKFVLVDLAGSEKANSVQKLNNEGSNINKSLLALANCISALVSSQKTFIPWRTSKLTRILQDSLSGNSKIVMIATISPSILSADETYYTLQYANRAKNIKINLSKNVVGVGQHNAKLDEVIKELKTEINVLKMELAEKEKNIIASEKVDAKVQEEVPQLSENLKKLQAKIIKHFEDEIKIRKKIIDKERQIEETKNSQAEKDYIYNNGPKSNKKEKNTSELQINSMKTDLNTLYTGQAQLIEKRKEIHSQIMEASKDDPNSLLLNIYKYYISFLENLSSEHRKYCNANEILRKDKEIDSLLKQLDFRDDFIIQAGQVIERNQGTFKYSNKNFVSQAEIEMNPYKIPVVKIENNSPQKMNAIRSAGQNVISDPKARLEGRFLMGPDAPTKKRQFNIELIPVLKSNNAYSPLQKLKRNFGATRRIISANSRDNSQENKRKYYNPQTDFVGNGSKYGYMKTLEDSKNRTRNYSNYSPNKKLNTSSSYKGLNTSSFSNNLDTGNNRYDSSPSLRFENEIQKKVKTILSKNYVGRYKNSPYLRK